MARIPQAPSVPEVAPDDDGLPLYEAEDKPEPYSPPKSTEPSMAEMLALTRVIDANTARLNK